MLDNCEHLVDAVAKLADQLLRASAGLRVLATSRESLNITGETVLPVPPLPAPDPGSELTLAQLVRFPAVALFAERAEQVVPGFSVTEANMAAVAGICRRLEGLPLALELAAARGRVLSAAQIEARLGDRLGLLTRGSRAHPARQQTLRGSIEWSYELCSEPERLLWARLSVFAGGFELDAVEGICADHRLVSGDLLELLAALADKSVLIAEHGEGGSVRYRLPERLLAYQAFLEANPDWRGRVVLLMIVVPSRTGVEDYQRMKSRIDELVGAVNGTFGSLEWTPVLYQYKSFPQQELVPLYAASDVMLVTPLRDGMNLVAKEYVATRADGRGC